MSIEETLRKQLTAALKAKEMPKANCIRMISTRVMERRTAKNFVGEVDDKLYVDVISAYRKSMIKAVEQFKQAGEKGAVNAAELQFEVDFLEQFVPKGLGDNEIRAAVKQAISDLGADSPKMIGRVMGEVMKAHKGLVEAGDVKRIAGEELARPAPG